MRLKGTPPKLLLATPLVVPGFPSHLLKAEDLKHTSKVIEATRVVKPGPSLGEILPDCLGFCLRRVESHTNRACPASLSAGCAPRPYSTSPT